MDPIANMLTSINNALRSGKLTLTIPHSKVKLAIAQVLLKYKFVGNVTVQEDEYPHPIIRLDLKYDSENQPVIAKLRRVSKPGRRVYIKANKIVKPRGGVGIIIISTPRGIMTGYQAKKEQLGGEVLCEVLS